MKNVCNSLVGKTGGGQTLNLGSNCYTESTIIHEFMHAFGVHHYQNRPDRDQYVTIHEDNIDSDNISPINWDLEHGSNTYGTEYDMKSFMHYRALDGSKNGKPVITLKVYFGPDHANC